MADPSRFPSRFRPAFVPVRFVPVPLSSPIRPLTATQNATRLLPEDSDLAAVIEAWDRLPEALKAGIVAMVKAASK